MTAALTLGVGAIYVAIAIGHFAHGRVGLGIAFTAYALANVGLVLAERGK